MSSGQNQVYGFGTRPFSNKSERRKSMKTPASVNSDTASQMSMMQHYN